ncbi:gliding motility-associated C-terminal domain-containing protein [Chitinophaga sp. sic0106]|uniref:T9SS type B sorting domain-containing protein n=1 Tax=Chitinophaga sp. sic0106 TaxID=2854785 RepID=UPI001C44A8F7|nr:gliding motility-associated C-terminal domain-containing protein [Chitinophaga sp. sic0106]MBV7532438.1 gliding motility-associated C-terminal domain-containing protein [Chitinophaga sp. sic0106]
MTRLLFLLLFSFVYTVALGQNTFYVNGNVPKSGDGKSWAGAYKTLKEAMVQANKGTQTSVYLAQGTYRSDTNIQGNTDPHYYIFTFNKSVSLYGGFPPTGNPGMADRNPSLYPTILSADVNNTPAELTDNALGLLVFLGNNKDTIDGLTISDVMPFNNSFYLPVSVNAGGDLTMNNVIIRNNRTGALSVNEGKLKATNLTVIDNTGFIGLLDFNRSEITVSNSLIARNNTNVLLSCSNNGFNTIGTYSYSNITMADNIASVGVYSLNLINRTVNCIFYNNTTSNSRPMSEWMGTNSNSVFSNCITQYTASDPAKKILKADPHFRNAAAGDYSLLGGSPAIDQGSSAEYAPGLVSPSITTIRKDLAGNERFIGNAVDIGAYEVQGAPVTGTWVLKDPVLTRNQVVTYQLLFDNDVLMLVPSNFKVQNGGIAGITKINSRQFEVAITAATVDSVRITMENNDSTFSSFGGLPNVSMACLPDYIAPVVNTNDTTLFADIHNAPVAITPAFYTISDNHTATAALEIQMTPATVSWPGQDITVSAKDEAGNLTEKQFRVTLKALEADAVQTVLPTLHVAYGTGIPAGALPSSLTIQTTDGQVADFPVTWDVSSFNSSQAGAYQLPGKFTLPAWVNVPAGLLPVITCIVEKRRDSSITAPASLHVPFGTKFAGLALPPVAVLYTDGAVINVPVQWSSGSYDGNMPGTYTLSGVLQPDVNSILSDSSIRITVTVNKGQQVLTVTPVADKLIGDAVFSLQGSSSAGLPVSWASDNPQVIALSGNTATVGQPGTAVITVTQTGNPQYEAAMPVTMRITVLDIPTPVITARGNTSFCAGDKATLATTSPGKYQWYLDGQTIKEATGNTLEVSKSGQYSLQTTHPNGYTNSSNTISITVYALPVIAIQPVEAPVSKGFTVQLQANGGVSYQWTPADGLNSTTVSDPIARPAVTTTYTVTGYSTYGCAAQAQVTITVKEDDLVQPANILTPNGDGINDRWVVRNLDMYPDNELKIFDRSGRMVYQQSHYANTWTGASLAEGTYYYVLTFGPRHKVVKGFITILR